MDKVDLQIAIELEKCLQPVQIPNTCSFWMIRTKSGVYYNEFIEISILQSVGTQFSKVRC